jgi:hypothetical protein
MCRYTLGTISRNFGAETKIGSVHWLDGVRDVRVSGEEGGGEVMGRRGEW